MKKFVKGFLAGLGFYLGCAFGSALEDAYLTAKEEAQKQKVNSSIVPISSSDITSIFQKNLEEELKKNKSSVEY